MSGIAPPLIPPSEDRIYVERVQMRWHRRFWRRARLVESIVLADLGPELSVTVTVTHATGSFVEHCVDDAERRTDLERRVPVEVSIRVSTSTGPTVEATLARRRLARTKVTITCTSPCEREALGLGQLLRRGFKTELRRCGRGEHRRLRRVIAIAGMFLLSYLGSLAANWPRW